MILFKDDCNRQVSEDAANQFYGRYLRRLLALVKSRTAARFAPRFDPEDIVQSVFRTWFARTRDGRISFSTQGDLWSLLCVIALRKVRNRTRFHDEPIRSVGLTADNAEPAENLPDATDNDAVEFEDLIDVARMRLKELPRRTLELTIQGLSVEDISTELGRTTRSVTRYRQEAGAVLEQLLADDAS